VTEGTPKGVLFGWCGTLTGMKLSKTSRKWLIAGVIIVITLTGVGVKIGLLRHRPVRAIDCASILGQLQQQRDPLHELTHDEAVCMDAK